MDEEKRKYLEELRRQIDPEILRKMAEHLGSGGDEDAAAFSALHGDSGAVSSTGGGASVFGPSSPADKIRERRASAFQRKVAERKREGQVTAVEKKDEPKRTLLIYSHKEFWSRIAESQFKNLGFPETQSFYDFETLVRTLFECMGQSDATVSIAVSVVRAVPFLKGWHRLKEQMAAQDRADILEPVQYLLVVESMKQVPEALLPLVGPERIIDLTGEVHENREKIRGLLNDEESAQ